MSTWLYSYHKQWGYMEKSYKMQQTFVWDVWFNSQIICFKIEHPSIIDKIVGRNGSSLYSIQNKTKSVWLQLMNTYVKRFIELWVGIHAAIRSNEYQKGFLEF